MNRYHLDYSGLADTVEKRRYKLAEVKNRIEKVAWDIVRFRDGEPTQLWQVQSADDGDYIVALYEEEIQKKEASAKTAWSAVVGTVSNDVHLFYKGDPVVRVAANRLGIDSAELDLVKRWLPNKLASNQKLVAEVLNMAEPSVRKVLIKKYPELA